MSLNKYRGEVTIDLDRPRKLRIDFNSIIETEELLKESFDLTRIFDSGAKGIRTLLWVCLKKEDPSLTIEQVGEMIGLCDQAKVMEAITESAYGGKIPDEVREKAKQSVNGEAKNALSLAGDSKTVSAGPSASA